MFNKKFTNTQLDPEETIVSLKELAEQTSKGTTEFIVDMEDAYMQRYFLPRIFLKRNFETAKRFVSDKKLFTSYASYDLLRDCDLTDFILAHKDSLEKYPVLFEHGTEYEMSDEAAWIVMENMYYSPDRELTQGYSFFHSIWFRAFTNEDTASPQFRTRIQNALHNHSNKGLTENITNREYMVTLVNYYDLIRSFHLGVTPGDSSRELFNKRIGGAFANSSLKNKKFITWVLELINDPNDFGKVSYLTPYILYGTDISDELRLKFKDAALHEMPRLVKGFHGQFKREIRHWREMIGKEGYEQLEKDYFSASWGLADFVLPEEMWLNQNFNLIIDLLNRTDKEVLAESRVRGFKNYVRHVLEEEFGVKTSFNGLTQLLSIYEATRV